LPADAVSKLAAAISEIAGAPVELERPADPSHGDYATNVALRSARDHLKPPRERAQEIADAAVALPEIERAEVAGPGFVNLWLAEAWYGAAVGEILASGLDYGAGWVERPERIQVEMVSANPTGPVVVSAARNGAYGDSVARLLDFAGHEVAREYYYNDAGTQMERFRASVEAARRGEETPEEGYHGAYIQDLAGLRGDPVPRMLEQIEATMERFRIHFDSWARQSEVESEIADALALLPTYEKDGATWVETTKFGDDKDRVAIRSSGEPTYFAADCAYMRHKLGRYDRAVYVLGADHHGYVARLQAIAAAFGYDPQRIEVLVYQLVSLVRGGEVSKMSKRAGDIVTLDEFLDETGVDFARWYLVDRGPDQPIEIDVALAQERSRKNPVYYVQYVHARTHGIFREAEEDAEIDPAPRLPLAPEERDLVKRLLDFPGVAREAAERRGPHAVPIYAITLADAFHRFYHEHRVLESKGGEHESFRLALVLATRHVIARCLDLIGVEAPERM
jgi:arginyl-tRNA synthetase